jgi:hypothetical protein
MSFGGSLEKFESTGKVREHLELLGIVRPGDPITKDDYGAIERRALVLQELAQANNKTLSEEQSLAFAYLDRMAITKKINPDLFQEIETEEFRGLLKALTGRIFTDEEIGTFLSHAEQSIGQGAVPSELFLKWADVRNKMVGESFSTHVVVDGEDIVHGAGTDPKKLMGNARGEI